MGRPKGSLGKKKKEEIAETPPTDFIDDKPGENTDGQTQYDPEADRQARKSQKYQVVKNRILGEDKKLIDSGITTCPREFNIKGDEITIKFACADVQQFLPLIALRNEIIVLAFRAAQGELPFSETPEEAESAGEEYIELPLTTDGPMPPKPASLIDKEMQAAEGGAAPLPESPEIDDEEKF